MKILEQILKKIVEQINKKTDDLIESKNFFERKRKERVNLIRKRVYFSNCNENMFVQLLKKIVEQINKCFDSCNYRKSMYVEQMIKKRSMKLYDLLNKIVLMNN